MDKKRRPKLFLSGIFLICLLAAACGPIVGRNPGQGVSGGDSRRGQQLIVEYGCNGCHTIPGMRRQGAMVGPPLTAWADRHYIAGNLPNTPENLIYWIQFPQVVEPGTAMPDMGITEIDARDIAAYLYTLRQRSPLQFPGITEQRAVPFESNR